MNKGRIQEIRERAEKASPGPWRHSDQEVDDGILHSSVSSEGDKEIDWVVETVDQTNHAANARFIAHARQDIPFLLDHISRLEKVLEASEELAKNAHMIRAVAESYGECDLEWQLSTGAYFKSVVTDKLEELKAAVAAARSGE